MKQSFRFISVYFLLFVLQAFIGGAHTGPDLYPDGGYRKQISGIPIGIQNCDFAFGRVLQPAGTSTTQQENPYRFKKPIRPKAWHNDWVFIKAFSVSVPTKSASFVATPQALYKFSFIAATRRCFRLRGPPTV